MLPDLMDGAGQTLRAVLANLQGRSADTSPDYYNTRLVAALARMAGGDVLEIGTLFGACAITTALCIAPRTVYCIDPLDGRKQTEGRQTTGDLKDWGSGVVMGPQVFRDNCKRNGAGNVVLVPKMSHPFPQELEGRAFGLAYIDGDHWHGQPLLDWKNVKDRTSRFVVFDDADVEHPHVMEAVRAAMDTPGWHLYLAGKTIYVMERDTDAEI